MINKISILNGAKYLVFIPAKYHYFNGTTCIDSRKSNETSEENIENVATSDNNFAPAFVDYHLFPDANFNGHSLIKNNISTLKK